MKPVLRNILAVIVGILAGGVLNMLIIKVSATMVPPPEGADITTMEGLKESMHLMQPKHFLMPFLAHALGTLLGAFVGSLIAVKNKMGFALGIGGWFLLGGIINIIMLPSPLWFTCVDLILAYLPMAFIGAKLAIRKQ